MPTIIQQSDFPRVLEHSTLNFGYIASLLVILIWVGLPTHIRLRDINSIV